MGEIVGAHNELHSEQGALRGEHPGRSRNPVIKVAGLAWLEFEKPDLDRAEAFAHAFGFETASRDGGELALRVTDAAAPCVFIRRGRNGRSRRMSPTRSWPGERGRWPVGAGSTSTG